MKLFNPVLAMEAYRKVAYGSHSPVLFAHWLSETVMEEGKLIQRIELFYEEI